MPTLACWTCGRQIDTVSPIESLSAEERRCPRCGARLNEERRESTRRVLVRRFEPPTERRVAERRKVGRQGRDPTAAS